MQMFIVQMHQVSKLHWVSKTKWFKTPFSLQWKSLEASTFTQGTQGSGNELVWTTYQLTNLVNTFLLTAIFLHKADLYDAQLTETLLWFSARKFELWKMISNEQPREWHRLPVTTCFRSKTTQVNNLNRGGLGRGGNCENLLSPFPSR